MRLRGNITTANNYEVGMQGPFDARQLTELKSDLYGDGALASWDYYDLYQGMIVSVAKDPIEENNGVYILKYYNILSTAFGPINYPPREEDWYKLASEEDFKTFQGTLEEQLSNYVTKDQISSFSRIAVGPLPETGEENTIYFTELDGNWEERIWHDNKFVIVGSNAAAFDNYYTKEEIDAKLTALENKIPDISNYYNKSEVNNLINSISTLSYKKVDTLPADPQTNIIYLVPKTDTESQDVYDEYLYVDGNWEKIGSTEVNLDGYVTTDALTTELASYAKLADIPDTSEFITSAEINERLGGYVTDESLSTTLSNYVTSDTLAGYATTTQLEDKQDLLISGTNIKTINGQSILGEGDLEITAVATVTPATDSTLGGILATDSSASQDVSAYVDVEEDGKAFVKIPSVDETSTAEDVINLLNTDTLVLNGNA